MPPAFRLHSPETGTEYQIHVAQPPEPGPWPAVLFMDGDDQFGAATAAYQVQRSAGRVPPLLLAGVGYGASYSRPANRRGRDYTPAAHPDEPSSGGADAFLGFLTRTLWPELVRRYPLQDHVRGIAGHSLGSLLALHALFQPRPFFTHFLVSAPSIWWADRAILQQAAALRRAQSRLPGRLFLTVGEEDSSSMTGDIDLLEQQLARQPFQDLGVTVRRIPRRNHYNVLPDAFSLGLASLFGVSPPA